MPDIITYSSMDTRETVCIFISLVMLHNPEVKAAGVLNAYVMLPNTETILTVSCPVFGYDAGKYTIIA